MVSKVAACLWLGFWLLILMQAQQQVSVATEHELCSLSASAMAQGVADIVAN